MSSLDSSDLLASESVFIPINDSIGLESIMMETADGNSTRSAHCINDKVSLPEIYPWQFYLICLTDYVIVSCYASALGAETFWKSIQSGFLSFFETFFTYSTGVQRQQLPVSIWLCFLVQIDKKVFIICKKSFFWKWHFLMTFYALNLVTKKVHSWKLFRNIITI